MRSKSSKRSWSYQTINVGEVNATPGPPELCLEKNHQDLNTGTSKTTQGPQNPTTSSPQQKARSLESLTSPGSARRDYMSFVLLCSFDKSLNAR